MAGVSGVSNTVSTTLVCKAMRIHNNISSEMEQMLAVGSLAVFLGFLLHCQISLNWYFVLCVGRSPGNMLAH